MSSNCVCREEASKELASNIPDLKHLTRDGDQGHGTSGALL